MTIHNSVRVQMGIRKKMIEDMTKEVLEVFKKDTQPMGISVLVDVLSNVLVASEYDGGQPSFNNQDLEWTIQKFYTKKIEAAIPSIIMLHTYCVKNNYTRDNLWRWGSGDRLMGFIPCGDVEKKVLYFNNQHMDFVCVIRHGYNDEIHIRQTYPDLFSPEHSDHGFYKLGTFHTVDDFREALKEDNGLEIALANLSSKYTTWSDMIPGNENPYYITLEDMIKHDFGKGCRAFETYSLSDESYVLSTSGLLLGKFRNHETANYVFEEVTDCVMCIPDDFLVEYERLKTINDIIENES